MEAKLEVTRALWEIFASNGNTGYDNKLMICCKQKICHLHIIKGDTRKHSSFLNEFFNAWNGPKCFEQLLSGLLIVLITSKQKALEAKTTYPPSQSRGNEMKELLKKHHLNKFYQPCLAMSRYSPSCGHFTFSTFTSS